MKWPLPLLLCASLWGQQAQGLSARETYVTHKAFHAMGGVMVYYAFADAGYPKTGLAVAWGLGIAKELYDRKHGGRFRAGDVAWTGAPATLIQVSFKW